MNKDDWMYWVVTIFSAVAVTVVLLYLIFG